MANTKHIHHPAVEAPRSFHPSFGAHSQHLLCRDGGARLWLGMTFWAVNNKQHHIHSVVGATLEATRKLIGSGNNAEASNEKPLCFHIIIPRDNNVKNSNLNFVPQLIIITLLFNFLFIYFHLLVVQMLDLEETENSQ